MPLERDMESLDRVSWQFQAKDIVSVEALMTHVQPLRTL